MKLKRPIASARLVLARPRKRSTRSRLSRGGEGRILNPSLPVMLNSPDLDESPRPPSHHTIRYGGAPNARGLPPRRLPPMYAGAGCSTPDPRRLQREPTYNPIHAGEHNAADMADHPHDILILERRIDHETLRRLVQDGFGDMVKFVADIRRGGIAIGGERHGDAAAVPP